MKNYVSTSTVLSFKYKNGIITATDTHGAYGHLSKFNTLIRTFKLTPTCIISYSGEYSDIQQLHKVIKYELIKDQRTIHPQGIHKMVQRILYSRRSQMKPLNVFAIISGIDEDKFVGAVNHLGNFYFSDVICNGIGAYLITPFLRDRIEGKIDEMEREDAIKIMEEALRLLFYRDCYAINSFNIGIVEKDYCEVSDVKKIETNWEIGRIPLE